MAIGVTPEECKYLTRQDSVDYVGFEPVFDPYGFTSKQIEDLEAASYGLTIKETADQQSSSPGTVKSRRKDIFRTSQSSTIAEAIVKGFLDGSLEFTADHDSEPPHLSTIHLQQLGLIAIGNESPDIARIRWVSAQTVKVHSRVILQKTGAVSMNHAMRRSFETGLFRILKPELSPQASLNVNRIATELGALTEFEQRQVLGRIGLSYKKSQP